MIALAQGFALGLAFAAPIGAQNVYVIRSAAHAPLRLSWRVALVVSLADVILAMASLFGLGALLTALPWLRVAVTVVGVVFLLYTGVSLLRAKPGDDDLTGGQPADELLTWRRIAGAAIVLTWFNPQALIDGAFILGGFRAQLDGAALPLFAVGMACASLMWFHALTFGIGSFRARFTGGVLRWINRGCGVLLCLLAAQLGYTLLR